MARGKQKPDGMRTVRTVVLGLIVLAAVGAGAWWFINRAPGEGRSSARETFEAYTNFVRPFLPPSGAYPSGSTLADWQEFLDDDMRDWFDANVDKLSFVGMRDPEAWKNASESMRESEAFRYLLSQLPWKGGSRQNEDLDEAAGRSEILYRFSGTQESTMILRKDGRAWVIDEIIGAREAIDQRMANVNLPE